MNTCGISELKNTLKATPPVIDLPVITVNGVTIDADLLSAEVQYHSADDLDQALQRAGQALVVRELLRQQLPEPDRRTECGEEAEFDRLIADNIEYQTIKDEEVRQYYHQNLAKFKTAPILEVSHILLVAAADDPDSRINKQSQAQDIIDRLSDQPDLLAEFALDYSDCPSKKMSGSLGQISTGQTVPEFERQLFVLPEGLHNRPLESRYGYHVVYIHKRLDGQQLEFNVVEDEIKRYLDHRRYRQAIGDYLYRLAQDADIEGIILKIEQENIIIN